MVVFLVLMRPEMECEIDGIGRVARFVYLGYQLNAREGVKCSEAKGACGLEED